MRSMSAEFKILFRNARKAARLTQQQIANELGVSHPAVQQWEAGKTHPSTEKLMALARILGPSILGWQEQRPDDGPMTIPSPTGYRVEPNATFEGPVKLPPRNGPSDIEELGITVGGLGDDDSAFAFNGQVIDMVTRPPGISNRKGVFALRVGNTSMVPKFEDGERVYVEPRKPAIGDYVVIELKPTEEGRPGKSFIKRLVAMNSARVEVEQFNPRGRLEFERDEIKDVFRVIPVAELLGM